MAVISSSGSAPASTSPTANTLTPKRRPAAKACSANSSAPPVSKTAEASRKRNPTTPDGICRGTHVASRMCADAPDNHGTVYADLDRVGHGLYRLRSAGRSADKR